MYSFAFLFIDKKKGSSTALLTLNITSCIHIQARVSAMEVHIAMFTIILFMRFNNAIYGCLIFIYFVYYTNACTLYNNTDSF